FTKTPGSINTSHRLPIASLEPVSSYISQDWTKVAKLPPIPAAAWPIQIGRKGRVKKKECIDSPASRNRNIFSVLFLFFTPFPQTSLRSKNAPAESRQVPPHFPVHTLGARHGSPPRPAHVSSRSQAFGSR